MAVLLIHITNTVFLYFTPMVEIWYGAGLSVLFYALLESNTKNKWNFALLLATEITVLFSHPENFILIFTFLALHVEKERKLTKQQTVLWAIFVVCVLIKALSFSSYEAEKVNHALDIEGSSDTLHMLDADYVFVLLEMLVKNYTAVVLLFLLSVIQLFVSKKGWRLLIFCSSFLGTIILINSVTTANIYDWYFEAMYLPMVSISIVVFLTDTLPQWKAKAQKTALVLLALFAIYNVASQWLAIPAYTLRVKNFQTCIEKLDPYASSKFVVNPSSMGLSKDDMTWSIPMEMLLLSAERGKEKTLSIATPDDLSFEEVSKIENDSSLFLLRRWDVIKNEQLNKKYFSIKQGAYKQIEP